MKQVVWSIAVVLVAALILAGMVVYTVSMVRTAQIRILTGEMSGFSQYDHRDLTVPSAFCRRLFLGVYVPKTQKMVKKSKIIVVKS